MNMNTRPARTEDAPVVARIVCALLAELDDSPLEALAESRIRQRAEEMLSDNSIFAFLALDDGRAIGAVTLNACSALYAGRFGEITELYVEPQYRDRGVGASLLSACIRFAEDRHWERLEVGTPQLPEWKRTSKFYEEHGFSHVGLRMKREMT